MPLTLLVFPSESLETYERSGYTGWFPDYFNPENLFERIVVCQRESHPQRNLHKGMTVASVPDIPLLGAWLWMLTGLWLCLRYRPGIIRAYNPMLAGWCGIFCQILTGIPCVVSIHNHYGKALKSLPRFSWTKWGGPLLIKGVIKAARELWVTSTPLVGYLLTYGARSEKIRVIPNKVRLKQWRPRNHRNGGRPFTFLYVGRLVKTKNVEILLQAAKELQQEKISFRLWIVGHGPRKEDLENFVRSQGLEGIVQFKGVIPHPQLPKVFAVADALVLPSFFEGFGIVLIEAQASELAIIASDIPETKDIVTSENALLFPPQDSSCLSRHMKSLMKDTGLRTRLVARSRDTVQKFAHETVSRLEKEAYQKVLSCH